MVLLFAAGFFRGATEIRFLGWGRTSFPKYSQTGRVLGWQLIKSPTYREAANSELCPTPKRTVYVPLRYLHGRSGSRRNGRPSRRRIKNGTCYPSPATRGDLEANGTGLMAVSSRTCSSFSATVCAELMTTFYSYYFVCRLNQGWWMRNYNEVQSVCSFVQDQVSR